MTREKALIITAFGTGVSFIWLIVSLFRYSLPIALLSVASLVVQITCLTIIYRSK